MIYRRKEQAGRSVCVIALAFASGLLHAGTSNVPAQNQPGLLLEPELDMPRYELLSEEAQNTAEALMGRLWELPKEQLMEQVNEAAIPEHERHYLSAQLLFEQVEYPDCESAFEKAAQSPELPRFLRARSWLMSYECAWADGRSSQAQLKVNPALLSGDLNKRQAAFLLMRETEYFRILPLLFDQGRTWPERVQASLFSTAIWEKSHYGMALISFRPNGAGQPKEIRVVSSYPDEAAGLMVEMIIRDRQLSISREQIGGLFLLRVLLEPN